MTTRLAGKVALITGGSGGIGAGIAKHFIAQGAQVFISDIDADRVNSVAGALGCTALTQDISDERRWTEIMAQIVDRHGRLDVLVNNAGILGSMERVTPEDTELEEFRRINAVNVEGTFLGCRAAIPIMRSGGGGSIVNLSSVTALMPTPHQMAYGASKAAILHLTKSVAAHGAKDRIRCNAIHPGQVATEMMQSVYDSAAANLGITSEKAVDVFKGLIPLGRIGTPDDIAMAALYLASDESSYVTGASLVVDGGILTK